jgi:hypothetical protein
MKAKKGGDFLKKNKIKELIITERIFLNVIRGDLIDFKAWHEKFMFKFHDFLNFR